MEMITVLMVIPLLIAVVQPKSLLSQNAENWKLSKPRRTSNDNHPVLTGQLRPNSLPLEALPSTADNYFNAAFDGRSSAKDVNLPAILRLTDCGTFCQLLVRIRNQPSGEFLQYFDRLRNQGYLLGKIQRSIGNIDMKRGASSEQSRGGWWTGPYGKRFKDDKSESKNPCQDLLGDVNSTEQTLDWCHFLFG
ncbi:uncharacterized protein [Antedon mediterranea]|uniref:uncharacterized protein n=1 Tax=Antedon mediterranea TaxID=105859 RepID=UPI003AF935BA